MGYVFKQPKEDMFNTMNISKKVICPIKKSPIRAKFSDVKDSKKIEFWHSMLNEFVVYGFFGLVLIACLG